jgi:hypothetical protein
MLSRDQILRTEQSMNALLHNINLYYDLYHSSRSQTAQKKWHDACVEMHRSTFPTHVLWLDETHRKIKEGNREFIEDTILFLEVDPWYFRSGYLKEKLLDILKQAPLVEDDKARLRRVIVAVAAGRNRREFRRFCCLALKITTEDFERELEEKAKEQHPESKGKLSYLLNFIAKHKHNA